MITDFLRAFTDMVFVNKLDGGRAPMNFRTAGHYVQRYNKSGPIGGPITQIITDPQGRLQATSAMLSSILQCGHLVTSAEQVAGQCYVCGRIVCRQCLAVCEFSGKTACRRHFAVVHGIVVSSYAQKGLWKHKAKKLALQKKELPYETKPQPKTFK